MVSLFRSLAARGRAALHRQARSIVEERRRAIVRSALQGRTTGLASGQDLIADLLQSGRPASVVRPGIFEARILQEFITRRGTPDPRFWTDYLEETKNVAANNAGILARDSFELDEYAITFLKAIRSADIISTFPWTEWLAAAPWATRAASIDNSFLNPISAILEGTAPWTMALEGKRVCVVSSFSNSVSNQLLRHESIGIVSGLFRDVNFSVVQSPVTFAGEKTDESWTDGLSRMKSTLAEVDYDVMLVAAGGYGPALANHAKETGKIGVHVGGTLQLFFGIRGKRWSAQGALLSGREDQLINWVETLSSEIPRDHLSVEGGAYW